MAGTQVGDRDLRFEVYEIEDGTVEFWWKREDENCPHADDVLTEVWTAVSSHYPNYLLIEDGHVGPCQYAIYAPPEEA